jgi:REP element-mobilizing transposase RayT
MARRARIKCSAEDSVYHVYNRVAGSLDWRPLLDPAARRLFVDILVFLLRVYCVDLVAYCLMGTHYHLLLRVRQAIQLSREELQGRAALLWPRARDRPRTDEQWRRFNDRLFDLSAFVKDLQSRFTREFNKMNERRGPLWAGRFGSSLLAPEAVLGCLHYVEFNPVAARLVRRPEDWRWSSARTRLDGSEPRPWPPTRVTGLRDEAAARRWFDESRALYAAQRRAREREEDWMWLRGRVVGSAEFVARFIDAEREPDRRPVPWPDAGWCSLDRLRPPRDQTAAA